MKRLRIIVFILIGFTVFNLWQSCKKGPEDPFFSIHSRLARVAGDWNITEYKVNGADSLRRVIDSVAFTGFCGDEIDKTVITYKYIWSFDKNGNFSEKLTRDSSIILDILNNTAICHDSTIVDSTVKVTVLNWNFTDGVGDLKNKEQLYTIDPETQEVTLYNIIELRNNEMKLERDVIDPVSNVDTLRQYLLERIK